MKKSFYEYSQNKNSGKVFESKSSQASQHPSGQNKPNQTGFNQKFNQGSGFKSQNSGNQTSFNNQRAGFGGTNFKNQTGFNRQNQNTGAGQEQIEETINKYKNMSQGELLSNLYSEVSKQKMQGTFDPVKLENAISSLGNFLTPEQQKNMKELLRKLK